MSTDSSASSAWRNSACHRTHARTHGTDSSHGAVSMPSGSAVAKLFSRTAAVHMSANMPTQMPMHTSTQTHRRALRSHMPRQQRVHTPLQALHRSLRTSLHTYLHIITHRHTPLYTHDYAHVSRRGGASSRSIRSAFAHQRPLGSNYHGMCVDMCADMCVDMRTDIRQACATAPLESLVVETVPTSTAVVYTAALDVPEIP